MTESLPATPRRPVRWVLPALLIVFLGAAALVGGRLLAGGGIRPAVNRELNVVPSPLLPQEAGVSGLFLGRSDNLLRIGTGDVTVHAIFDSQGRPTGDFVSAYDGPVIEVILTAATQLFRDDTVIPLIPDDQVDLAPIHQQVTRIDALGELTPDTILQVWGSQSGDRLIADAILLQIH